MIHKKMNLPTSCTVLNVVVVGRVSRPTQDIKNLDAGYDYAEQVLKDVWDGETDVRRFGEQGSGMIVERRTALEVLDLIERRWPHLILMEDVSKIYRNPRWIYTFVQDCVEKDLRLIAPGDVVDTYDENWEVALGAAVLRHGLHIPDTRRRVRRTASYAFEHGGMVIKPRAGYRKLTKEEASSGQFGPVGLRLAKLADWTPIIRSLREMVMRERKGGEALAYWLNTQIPPIPVPPSCKQEAWTGKLVLDWLRDPILCGWRQFPKVRHEPRFSDGKHKRIKNPNPPRQYYAELAHMTEQEHKEMVAMLDEIGKKEKAAQQSGTNSRRYRVARSKSLMPLQHATCSVCQGIYYMVGKHVAKCCNALTHTTGGCWNHVQIDCRVVREKIVAALLEIAESNPAAKDAFFDAAWENFDRVLRRTNRSNETLDKQIHELRDREDHLATAIANGGNLDSLVKLLKTTQAERKKLETQRREQTEQAAQQKFPASKDSFQIDPRQTLLELANTSFEFADLMRRIIPSFIIEPVQALDSAQVRPQGRLIIDLSALLPKEQVGTLPTIERVIELFHRPEHIGHLDQILKLRESKIQNKEKCSLKTLAKELAIGHMTVKRALNYHRLMVAAGLEHPYRLLTQMPELASRWKPKRKAS